MAKIDPIQIKILMLRRGITGVDLARKFGVGKSAISMALRGDRKNLLSKISRHVKSLRPRKAA